MFLCYTVPPGHLRLHLRSQEGDITYLVIIGREYVCFYVILFLLDISGFIYDPRKET